MTGLRRGAGQDDYHFGSERGECQKLSSSNGPADPEAGALPVNLELIELGEARSNFVMAVTTFF